jgi:hypothetical protein
MSDSLKLKVELKFQNQAINRINNGVLAGVTDLFEQQVLPAAQEMSPVLTGANRDSLSVKVRRYRRMIRAAIFTQSGHGGYLEVGTSKMPAQPYIHPAFERSLPSLNALLQQRIEEFSEMDALIEESGAEGLAAALKSGKWRKKGTKKA